MGEVKCWDFFACADKNCPAHKTEDLKCWLIPGTYWRNEHHGKFLNKIEICVSCKVFKANMDVAAMRETSTVINKQFRQFERIVKARDRELEGIILEVALSLSEVFEALKRISAGDPSVRVPEQSKIELIAKLKHMVNITAGNIGEIVDQAHEFATSLAEHFEVLHKVSKGDLNSRVSGGSKVELLESLREVTNETIENISREIMKRTEAENNLIKEKSLIDSAINSLPCVFFLIDENGRTLRWNRNLEVVTGYSSEEISKMSPVDFFDGEEKKLIEDKIQEVYVTGQSTAEAHLVSKDGRKRPYLFTELRFTSNNQNYFVSVGIDITDKKLTENTLREKVERETLILSYLPIAFYTTQPFRDFCTIWVSEQIDRISGFIPERFNNEPHLRISRIHPEDHRRVLEEIESIYSKGTIVTEYRWQCANGSYNWFRDQAVLIRNKKGEPEEIVGALLDITDRKLNEEALHKLSLADELTGLYNRRGFFTLAEQQLKIANRIKKKILLLFADLDDLKWINDNLGHNEGDSALIEIANILQKTFRESDLVARIGGDEFAVLAVETEETNAAIITTRLLDSLKNYNSERKRDYNLSVSIGISRYDPGYPCSIDKLLARADKLMYKFKRKNRPVSVLRAV
jgi:diguanylate cyclase (GGDEF)-like protein/PAS domain S-box-containing protein